MATKLISGVQIKLNRMNDKNSIKKEMEILSVEYTRERVPSLQCSGILNVSRRPNPQCMKILDPGRRLTVDCMN